MNNMMIVTEVNTAAPIGVMELGFGINVRVPSVSELLSSRSETDHSDALEDVKMDGRTKVLKSLPVTGMILPPMGTGIGGWAVP